MNHMCKNVWFCSNFQVAGSSPPVEEKSEVQSGSSSGEDVFVVPLSPSQPTIRLCYCTVFVLVILSRSHV